MTTWTAVVKSGQFGFGQFGYGPFGGFTSAQWTTVSQDGSSWVQVAQSGKVEAMFEYNEPLGGPVWTAVTQDA